MNIVERKNAKARGEITYFTGQPCKHGHISYRYTNNGACSQCMKIANGGDVDQITHERRQAKLSLARVNLRCYVEDRGAVAAAAYALAVMRFPVLTMADVDPRLLPTDKSGGTALYAFHCHDDDIVTLRSIAHAMIDSHHIDIQGVRQKVLAGAATYLPADSTPPISFK